MTKNPAVELEEMIRIAVRGEMDPDLSGELDAITLGDLLAARNPIANRRGPAASAAHRPMSFGRIVDRPVRKPPPRRRMHR